jgi:hypothetical protein
MPIVVVLVRHGEAALPAQMPVIVDHAFGNFRHIRNEIGAKPHCIGRAGLAGLGRALGKSALKADQQKSGRQRRPADKTHGPQHMVIFLGFLPVTSAA